MSRTVFNVTNKETLPFLLSGMCGGCSPFLENKLTSIFFSEVTIFCLRIVGISFECVDTVFVDHVFSNYKKDIDDTSVNMFLGKNPGPFRAFFIVILVIFWPFKKMMKEDDDFFFVRQVPAHPRDRLVRVAKRRDRDCVQEGSFAADVWKYHRIEIPAEGFNDFRCFSTSCRRMYHVDFLKIKHGDSSNFSNLLKEIVGARNKCTNLKEGFIQFCDRFQFRFLVLYDLFKDENSS